MNKAGYPETETSFNFPPTPRAQMDSVVAFKYDEDNLLPPLITFVKLPGASLPVLLNLMIPHGPGPLCLFSPFFYVRRLLMKKLKITLAQLEHTALKCGCLSTKCGDANISRRGYSSSKPYSTAQTPPAISKTIYFNTTTSGYSFLMWIRREKPSGSPLGSRWLKT